MLFPSLRLRFGLLVELDAPKQQDSSPKLHSSAASSPLSTEAKSGTKAFMEARGKWVLGCDSELRVWDTSIIRAIAVTLGRGFRTDSVKNV